MFYLAGSTPFSPCSIAKTRYGLCYIDVTKGVTGVTTRNIVALGNKRNTRNKCNTGGLACQM